MLAPARYHAIRDKMTAAVDRTFAEPITHFPLKDGKADATRAKADIDGVLRVGEGKNTNATGGFAQSWQMRIEAGKAQLHVDRAAWPDLVVTAGDKFRAMSRIGQPWFTAIAVDDRGGIRLLIELAEA